MNDVPGRRNVSFSYSFGHGRRVSNFSALKFIESMKMKLCTYITIKCVQCQNCRKFTLIIMILKKFVKATFLLVNFTKYFFSEWREKRKFLFLTDCDESSDSQCNAIWKLLQFGLTHFWQKFRESNVFTKEIIKELI